MSLPQMLPLFQLTSSLHYSNKHSLDQPTHVPTEQGIPNSHSPSEKPSLSHPDWRFQERPELDNSLVQPK